MASTVIMTISISKLYEHHQMAWTPWGTRQKNAYLLNSGLGVSWSLELLSPLKTGTLQDKAQKYNSEEWDL